MKTLSLLFLLVLFTQQGVAEDSHHHEGHQKTTPALKLDNGEKWPTDKALRTNMSEIHDHVKKDIGKIKKNLMTMSEYQKLGRAIEVNIKTIFKKCKLPTKADAQLHIIMAGLLGANKTLTDGSSKIEKRKAIDEVLMNYRAYLDFFDSTVGNVEKK